MQYEPRPKYKNSWENKRTRHTAERKQLLEGDFENLVERMMLLQMSTKRREAWGVCDLSANIAESITRELSQLYRQPPTISNEGDLEALIGRDGFLKSYWGMMIRQQQNVLFLRESFSRIDYIPPKMEGQKGRFAFRIVTPDVVFAIPGGDGQTPVYYQELKQRYYTDPLTEKKKVIWTVDVFDIRDPSSPRYAIHRIDTEGILQEDYTEMYTGRPALEGDDYFFRYSTGEPFIPVTLYHAENTGKMFSPFDKIELFSSTLVSCMLYTYFLHVIKTSAFEQKYVAGLHLQGLETLQNDQPARRAAIETDPSSILIFNSDPDLTQQPMIGSFAPAAKPMELIESIQTYERRAAATFNIDASFIRQNADPRSGYALSLDQSAKRSAQRSFSPIFSPYDEEFIGKVAALANRLLGTDLPETNYRIQYARIPLSPTEQEEERKDILEKMAAGLLSKIDAYIRLNPDCDHEEARRELNRIRKENLEFNTPF